jgi:hypothetical protein
MILYIPCRYLVIKYVIFLHDELLFYVEHFITRIALRYSVHASVTLQGQRAHSIKSESMSTRICDFSDPFYRPTLPMTVILLFFYKNVIVWRLYEYLSTITYLFPDNKIPLYVPTVVFAFPYKHDILLRNVSRQDQEQIVRGPHVWRTGETMGKINGKDGYTKERKKNVLSIVGYEIIKND